MVKLLILYEEVSGLLLRIENCAYPPLFLSTISFFITSPTQQCPQEIDFGQVI